jgi:four helix bundle protein
MEGLVLEPDGPGYQSFLELDVWKRGRKLKLQVYEVLPRYPAFEQYELTSQLRRSVRSVPTNVSEGHGRFTFKDQLNFCIIARGSLSETLNHLIDAYDCKYITEPELRAFKQSIDELGKMLNAYISYLKSRQNTTS